MILINRLVNWVQNWQFRVLSERVTKESKEVNDIVETLQQAEASIAEITETLRETRAALDDVSEKVYGQRAAFTAEEEQGSQ